MEGDVDDRSCGKSGERKEETEGEEINEELRSLGELYGTSNGREEKEQGKIDKNTGEIN